MIDAFVPLDWAQRVEPLEPQAMLLSGQQALQAARRLLVLPATEFAQLRFVHQNNALVLDSQQALPWVDSALYLGAETTTPQLLMPTDKRCLPNAAMAYQALRQSYQQYGQQHGQQLELSGAMALLPQAGGSRCFSLHHLAPCQPQQLAQWLDAEPWTQ